MSIRKKISILLILTIIICFVLSPFSKYPLSLAVMSVYSKMEEGKSIMTEKGIDIRMPGGCSTPEDDWYPFVMTYNSFENFGQYVGNDNLKLTIMYNFPAFDIWKGCSRIYDVESPYYSGFYGAYFVCGKTSDGGEKSEKFGYLADGSIDTVQIGNIPKYDLQRLVLQDFGLSPKNMVFQWDVSDVLEEMEVAGTTGWTKIDAKVVMNGLMHRKRENVRSYIQYGSPNYLKENKTDAETEFAPVEMVGRIYCKYLEKEDTSVFLYVLAKDKFILEKTDKDMIQKSSLQVVP